MSDWRGWLSGVGEQRKVSNSDLQMVSLAMVLGSFFYAAGNFGFLNLFAIRREGQILLILLLLPFVPVVAGRMSRWVREPLWLMVGVMILAEVFLRRGQSIFFLIDRLGGALVVALLFSFGYRLSERVLKVVIVLSCVFSTMVVIQAVLVWFEPGVLSSFVLGYTSGTQAEKVEVNHAFEYLGLVTPGIAWVGEHPFARFRSFASEPSVLVCAFLVPGILALGFDRPFRLMSIPILVFAGILAASGTIWLSLFLGVLSIPLLYLFRKRVFLLSIAPFVVAFAWYNFVSTTDIRPFTVSVSSALEPFEPYEGALNKVVSGTSRLSWVATYYGQYEDYMFGAASDPGIAVGLLLHMYMYFGVVGLALGMIVSYRILRGAVLSFNATTGSTRIMCALIFGIFLQIMAVSEFGWMSLPGFMMLTLISRRLEFLGQESRSSIGIGRPSRFEADARPVI